MAHNSNERSPVFHLSCGEDHRYPHSVGSWVRVEMPSPATVSRYGWQKALGVAALGGRQEGPESHEQGWRGQWTTITRVWVRQLEERHFSGILLLLPVTNQQDTERFQSFWHFWVYVSKLQYSTFLQVTYRHHCTCPGFGKEQGTEWRRPVKPGRAQISCEESDEKSPKKDRTSLHL